MAAKKNSGATRPNSQSTRFVRLAFESPTPKLTRFYSPSSLTFFLSNRALLELKIIVICHNQNVLCKKPWRRSTRDRQSKKLRTTLELGINIVLHYQNIAFSKIRGATFEILMLTF